MNRCRQFRLVGVHTQRNRSVIRLSAGSHCVRSCPKRPFASYGKHRLYRQHPAELFFTDELIVLKPGSYRFQSSGERSVAATLKLNPGGNS